MSSERTDVLGILGSIMNVVVGGLMGIVLLAVGVGVTGFAGYSVFVAGGSTSGLILGVFGLPFAAAGGYTLYKTVRGKVEAKSKRSKTERRTGDTMEDVMDDV